MELLSTVDTVVWVNARYCAKFRGSRSNRSWDMASFPHCKNGDCPPSVICYRHHWTTHEEHLVALIIVQNFVAIDSVVSIIGPCKCWTSLAWKYLLTTQKWRFGDHTHTWKAALSRSPKGTSLHRNTSNYVYTMYRSLRLVQPFSRKVTTHPFTQPTKSYALQCAIHSPKSVL